MNWDGKKAFRKANRPELKSHSTLSGFIRAEKEQRKLPVSRSAEEVFFAESRCTLQPEESQPEASWTEKRAAVQALRFFGRLSPENARAALDEVSAESPSDELREFYDELKFEFEMVFETVSK